MLAPPSFSAASQTPNHANGSVAGGEPEESKIQARHSGQQANQF